MQSYRNPAAHWLGSPNFTPDREGHDMALQPAYVIIHTMVGTLTSANQRFQQSSEEASAHYGVALNGSLAQWVDEKDAAWHAGNFDVNLDSIGIEHEDNGDYNGPRTPELYNASAALVRDICQRYGIPVDRAHVRKHSEVSDRPTGCPDALDIDWIVQAAASGTFDRGGPHQPPEQHVEDTVVPSSPVRGTIFRNARWYNWDDLAQLQTTDETGSTGAPATWTEAKRVGGVWYDRISGPGGGPGAWALRDDDIDDGGFDPTHFRPTPPDPSPPPPPPGPSRHLKAVQAIQTARKALDEALAALNG